MLETIGKKLQQTRIARGLTIEEAAHATHVRPDKLIALENDDYSRFGSNAYAKGFLQIYGRYLNIDVTESASLLQTPRQVTVSDYQYLSNAPAQEVNRIHVGRNSYSQKPSIMPLLLFMGVLLIAGGSYIVFLVSVTNKRLEPAKPAPRSMNENSAMAEKPASDVPASNSATPQTDAPVNSVADGRTPAGAPQVSGAAPTPVAPNSSAPEGSSGGPKVEIRRAELANSRPFAGPTPAGTESPATVVASPSGVNEIVVQALKKTSVTIRRDSPTSPPIFDGLLYPGPPLKLKGARFFVEVRDQDAVQIRKNGSPIAYQAPGISIQ